MVNPQKSSWPKQTALVVSDSPNVHMLLREMLRSYHWTVSDALPSVDQGMSAIRQGQACMIIIDDSANTPAARALRYLLSDAAGITTPTLSFTLESNKPDLPALAKIGLPKMVEKPLTPAKFLPTFLALIKMWEKDPFLSMRRATYQHLTGNDGACIKALLKLTQIKESRTLASQCLSLHLRRLGKIKEAETMLLNLLKKTPRDLGTILLLADLYLNCAMPRLAYRLLTSARNAYPNSPAVLVDSVQSALLSGDISEAITHLLALERLEYVPKEINGFLARMLYAEGRGAESDKALNNNRVAIKRIHDSWTSAELVNINISA